MPGRSCYKTVLEREVHYTEFGDANTARVHVVMVHGFVRTCRDFDYIAEFLSVHMGAHVICPDVIGRGLSQWSPDPENEYNPVYYANVVGLLLTQLGIKKVVYFGTSMGGVMAMLAFGLGLPLAAMVEKLVLNDVGPFVNPASLQRIMTYVVTPATSRRVSDIVAAATETYKGFGYHLTDDQRWRLLEPCLRRLEDGQITMHWDPSILKGLKPPPPGTPDMWYFYDKIACPTLVVRGVDSDVLLLETLNEMLQRGPKPRTVTIPDCGHAPVFMNDDDCRLIQEFLEHP